MINVMIVEDQMMPKKLFEILIKESGRYQLLFSIENASMLEYEKGYSGDAGYQLSESTYNGRKCMVMMHDGADNNDYEAEIEIVVYDDDGSSVAIHVSTLNEPLSSILANTDLMATATHVTW